MIANKTRKTVLCKKVELAASHFSKARGLMFRTSLNGGMLFVFDKESRASIWTFGMFMPIDIVWIGSKNRVVDMKENALPWRYLGWPKKKAKMVLELKSGTLKKTGTRRGDLLEIHL